jgi:hypothetical protein
MGLLQKQFQEQLKTTARIAPLNILKRRNQKTRRSICGVATSEKITKAR